METKKFEIYKQSNLIVEEAYSFLIANFNFCNYDNKLKSIALLSCTPSEGKTTIAINLSINFAKNGFKTLLVDADLRKPVVAKRLSEEIEKGLSNYLTQGLNINDVIKKSNIENLDYLPCGSKVMNPSAMLSSISFIQFIKEVSLKYDLVIFDTPALSSVIDGYCVASKVDATLLAVKTGEVRLPKLKRIKKQLEKAHANVIGVVLNRVSQEEYKKSFEAYDYFTDDLKFTNTKNNKRK